jgi:hypothetical protein
VLYYLVIPSIIINLVNSLYTLSKLTSITRLYNIIGEEVEVGKVEGLLRGRLTVMPCATYMSAYGLESL